MIYSVSLYYDVQNVVCGDRREKEEEKTKPCPVKNVALKYHNDDNTDDYKDDDEVDPTADIVGAA
jgi:hypothetical protein